MFFEGTEIYLYCNHFTKRIQLLDKVMYNVLDLLTKAKKLLEPTVVPAEQ